jgi:hypothetical protein
VLERGRKQMGSGPRPYTPPTRPEGQLNTTDPDARRMKQGPAFMPPYNAQAVTTEQQVVIAAEITTEGVDFEQLDPMIATAERELESAGVKDRPGVVVADAGYWSNGHIDSLRERGIVPIVAPDTAGKGPRKTRLGGPYDFVRRVIATEQGGALHSQRQWMVEPVFAQIKTNRRIDRFKRRGLAAARSEWRLITATHNLLKLYRHSIQAAGPEQGPGSTRPASAKPRSAAPANFARQPHGIPALSRGVMAQLLCGPSRDAPGWSWRDRFPQEQSRCERQATRLLLVHRSSLGLKRATLLHRALERLAGRGLVRVEREKTVEGRLRRYLPLTGKGRETLVAEADRLAAAARVVKRRLSARVARGVA